MNKNIILSDLLTPELYGTIFDAYRLVDVSENMICEVLNNKITSAQVPCFQIWNRKKPCDNCICFRAAHQKEQMMKLEYNNGTTFLIIAIPLTIAHRSLVLEMIKDVSHSMISSEQTLLEENRLSSLIDKLNTFATSDAATGLHNQSYLLKHLSEEMKQENGNQSPCTIMTIYIKNLSEINRTYGKDVGALIMFRISQILNSHIKFSENSKEACWAARYDNSTLFLIYQQQSAPYLQTYVTNLKTEIEQIQIYTKSTPPKIQVAFSLTQYHDQNQDVLELIQSAISKAI